MFTSNTYNPDSQPLGHYRGHPVYLATVLVVAHIVMMLAGVVSPSALSKLVFAPGIEGNWGEIWRWGTYPFVHVISLWFVVEMFFLFRFGIEIERVFGRKVLARLYAGLVLLPAALVAGAWLLGISDGYMLGGTDLSHFCLFLGICFLYPGAALHCSVPWLTLKLMACVFLAVYVLRDLSSRDFMHLGLLLANVGLTYAVLRQAGLTPRFERVTDALRNALPSPKPAAARRLEQGSAGRPKRGGSSYYEPKIKPKADLAPERKAVEEVDALLDKIARSGMDSLTPAEKAALQRASSRLKDPD